MTDSARRPRAPRFKAEAIRALANDRSPDNQEKERLEALWTLARGTSMIVIFQLMADSQHRDRFAVFDFE
jgi:hypothetical protein